MNATEFGWQPHAAATYAAVHRLSSLAARERNALRAAARIPFASVAWRLLDGNLTRWALGRQSARALSKLRRVLEG
jgi:hypothetical protein